MSITDSLKDKLKGVILDLSPLQSYKDQPIWQQQAKDKIDRLRKIDPKYVTPLYEVAFIHGYVEGRVEAVEEKRLAKTPGQFVEIKLDDGRIYHISKAKIADDRATFYSERDTETDYSEEYNFLMSNTEEANDIVLEWLWNEMDWWEMNPVLVHDERRELRDCTVEKYYHVQVQGQPCLPGLLIDENLPKVKNETE